MFVQVTTDISCVAVQVDVCAGEGDWRARPWLSQVTEVLSTISLHWYENDSICNCFNILQKIVWQFGSRSDYWMLLHCLLCDVYA